MKRYGGVTIFGAVGNCISKSLFITGKSTNRDEFKQFIETLVGLTDKSKPKPYLILDNHAAHKCNSKLLNDHFEVMWMPPYSCEFNSIEHCWGMMKEKFKRRFAQAVHNIKSDSDFKQLVELIISQIPEETYRAFVTANRNYLQKFEQQ